MKLGATQSALMDCLKEHKYWHYEKCGWIWSSRSGTKSTLDSLVKKGLVCKDENGFYTLLNKKEPTA